MKKILIFLGIIFVIAGAFGLIHLRNGLLGGDKPGQTRSRDTVVVVEVTPVTRGSIVDQAVLVGNIKADVEVNIYSKLSGIIKDIFKNVGDEVAKDELIIQIEDEELRQNLRQAEAALEVAQATLKKNQPDYAVCLKELARAKTLWEKNLLSQEALEETQARCEQAQTTLELNKAQINQSKALVNERKVVLNYTRIVSPIDGLIAARYFDKGSLVSSGARYFDSSGSVSSGAPILSIVNIDKVIIKVQIPEKDVPMIYPGMMAVSSLEAYAQESFTGRVIRISPVLDPGSHTAEVEIEFSNQGHKLKPGMHTILKLVYKTKKDVLLIPKEALVHSGEVYGVFLVSSDKNTCKYIAVEIGIRDDKQVEIISDGLNEGDSIITLGKHLLEDGAKIKVH